MFLFILYTRNSAGEGVFSDISKFYNLETVIILFKPEITIIWVVGLLHFRNQNISINSKKKIFYAMLL